MPLTDGLITTVISALMVAYKTLCNLLKLSPSRSCLGLAGYLRDRRRSIESFNETFQFGSAIEATAERIADDL